MSSNRNQQPLDLNYYSAILSASYQLHIPAPFPQLLNPLPLVPLSPYQQAQPTPVLIPTPSAAIPPNPPGQSELEQRLAASERALEIEVAARQKLQKQETQFTECKSKLEEVTRKNRKLSWENEKLQIGVVNQHKAELDTCRANLLMVRKTIRRITAKRDQLQVQWKVAQDNFAHHIPAPFPQLLNPLPLVPLCKLISSRHKISAKLYKFLA
ncbi:hypothetical protein Ddc_21346 [Ditylenchus destructor]|nr:hypothetical protein Ddc_21346 [Ditylenchus destructor]